ncbi:hypothetical protein NMG46_11490 [Mesorhizobium sp. LMG 17147]|uniref:hypothetical protein n=1 Tax=Mesorhizobium sp. LMG 17147 TaxID=2963091 RepID=UPI0020C9489F|nr:hypothetical protein [Mesorhizobium sp. LMG 17147]MCP9230865.1 hypothetical protein [Mesorhizobium sp. LMG 17147]
MRVEFHGLTFDLPAGWVDIAGDLPEGSPPTLAKETDGCGAIQFSIAKYRSGEKPNVDVDVLRTFMIQFCNHNSIDVRHITQHESEGIVSVGVLSETTEKLLSAWYMSNGNDFVFMTYLCLADEDYLEELDVARSIVSSISF